MKIKAIFFDMDGVLIEAKDWHYESLNKSLGLFGTNIYICEQKKSRSVEHCSEFL